MKKTVLSIVSLLVCLAAAFALASCSLDSIIDSIENGESVTELTADDKEGSLQLLNSLLEKALENPNVVVTVKNGDNVVYTESVLGENDYTFYTEDNKAYAVKDGDSYYMVSMSDTNYYLEDEAMYDYNYCHFKDTILSPVKAAEGGKFTCTSRKVEKDGKSEGELDFSYSNEGVGVIKIKGTDKDGLVQTVNITVVDTEKTVYVSITFEYGTASFEIPDFKSWDAGEDGEETDSENVGDDGE